MRIAARVRAASARPRYAADKCAQEMTPRAITILTLSFIVRFSLMESRLQCLIPANKYPSALYPFEDFLKNLSAIAQIVIFKGDLYAIFRDSV